MTEQTSNSLVNLGNLTKPATTLIEKISDAVSVIYEPTRGRRSAKAQADVDRVMAESEIEITDLHRRAARRRLQEDAKHQENMESIIAKSFSDLKDNATPESMDNDWVANFFDKSRIVSDEEMQSFWARILAGEANAPGTFSKRTINSLTGLDKSDAELFTRFCGFVWNIGVLRPLVLDFKAGIYNRHGIDFSKLQHLESIGLIQFSAGSDFILESLPKRFIASYYGRWIGLELPKDTDNQIKIGKAMLTRIGEELAPICGGTPVEGFREYVMDQWKKYLPKAGTG